jgi:hypothetical protein
MVIPNIDPDDEDRSSLWNVGFEQNTDYWSPKRIVAGQHPGVV